MERARVDQWWREDSTSNSAPVLKGPRSWERVKNGHPTEDQDLEWTPRWRM